MLQPAARAAEGTLPWQVLLFNDRMNTKTRVAAVLNTEAGLSASEAEQIMSEAHTRGRATVRAFAQPGAEAAAAALLDRLRTADLLVEAEQQQAVAAAS